MTRHPMDFFNPLTLAKAHAQLYAEEYPEHAHAIECFLQELDRITGELKSALGYGTQKP